MKCVGYLVILLMTFYALSLVQSAKQHQQLHEHEIEKLAKGQGRMDAGDGTRSLTSVKSIRLDKRKKRSQYEIENNQGREVLNNLLQDEVNGNGILIETSPVVLDRFILSPETNSMQPNDPLPPMMYLMLLQKIKEMQDDNEKQLSSSVRKTPRLGRSVDLQPMLESSDIVDLTEDYQDNNFYPMNYYIPSLMKKSVAFKPRLGKRMI